MNPLTYHVKLIFFALIIFFATSLTNAKSYYPEKNWSAYVNIEDAGFSKELLEKAKIFNDSINSVAVMIIHNGVVVANWGETSRRFRLHSVRKSLMSAMYGIYVDNGTIDTNKTLAQLGINDSPRLLTDEEKQARIVDLLSARSGIYLPAAYEPATNRKPARGSFAPGTNWCYNNWDFNTLLTIFEQETGKQFFNDFDLHIAQPLQMQDYNPSHGYYHYELENSSHPAYPLRLSARDMARFGLLYLNNGKWNDTQILSEEYIRSSTSWISINSYIGGYGYMWWLSDKEQFKSLGLYSALGVGEQTIDILPGANLVVVLRTNTYVRSAVRRDENMKLLELILNAKTNESTSNPKLLLLPSAQKPYTAMHITNEEMQRYSKKYPLFPGFNITISNDEEQLYIEKGEGTIPLHKIDLNKFIIEDFHHVVYFTNNSSDKTELITLEKFIFESYEMMQEGKYNEALKVLHEAQKYYPKNSKVMEFIAEAKSLDT